MNAVASSSSGEGQVTAVGRARLGVVNAADSLAMAVDVGAEAK